MSNRLSARYRLFIFIVAVLVFLSVCRFYTSTDAWKLYVATGLQWRSGYEIIEIHDNVSSNLRADTTRTIIVKVNDIRDSFHIQSCRIHFSGKQLTWKNGPINAEVPINILDIMTVPFHGDCIWCATLDPTGRGNVGMGYGVYVYDKKSHMLYVWLNL